MCGRAGAWRRCGQGEGGVGRAWQAWCAAARQACLKAAAACMALAATLMYSAPHPRGELLDIVYVTSAWLWLLFHPHDWMLLFFFSSFKCFKSLLSN